MLTQRSVGIIHKHTTRVEQAQQDISGGEKITCKKPYNGSALLYCVKIHLVIECQLSCFKVEKKGGRNYFSTVWMEEVVNYS